MLFRQLFDKESSTYTYLCADEVSRDAIIFDSVIEQHDRDVQLIKELNLNLVAALETHIHADHITGAGLLRKTLGCKIFLPSAANVDSADKQLIDNDRFQIGSVSVRCLSTPGHTNCSMSYLLNENCLLTGDTLFIRGCGRTDFQQGDAGELYDVITSKLFSLPKTTRVYPGHDYKGMLSSTIGEEIQFNPRFAGKNREEFIELMSHLNLPNPKKIDESVPANLNCGVLSEA